MAHASLRHCQTPAAGKSSALAPQPCRLPLPATAVPAPCHANATPRPSRTQVVPAAAKSGSSKSAKGSNGGKGFGAANAPSVSKTGVSQTCACGSKSVYRECCEPYHTGAAVPPDVEAALRARFCAFVKGRAPYIVGTFHPLYHTFKYDTTTPGGATDQLKRDVEAGIKRFTYSNFKVLEVKAGSHPDEAFITFRYNSVNKVNPDRNFDGSIKVNTTVERSRFLRDAASKGAWLFADYELIEYPAYLEEAKEAERKARAAAAAAAGPAADDELKARDASAAAAEL